MKKNYGFGLLGIIIVIILTAVISSVATGVIMLNSSSANINKNINDEDLQEFIDVYETLLSKYYDDIDKKGMLNAAEEGMLNFLGDKYTTYLDDNEYQEILDELSATYYGIGVTIEGNRISKVTSPSPAADAGLMAGDLIINLNGVNVELKDSTAIAEIIKQSNNDTIEVDVSRNGEDLHFSIIKTKLTNTAIDYKVLDNTSIGYISIGKFSENLADQVETGLKELENAGITSLIIDVRDNAGGYLNAAQETTGLFLEKGKIIYSLKTSNNKESFKDDTEEKREYPIVVLINNNSASAAEILASALKDSYGATIVGSKSYGKGKVQQVSKLSNGDSVKYTTAEWLTPNDICIDGIGIYPDYDVIYSKTELYDTQIEKAMELLS